MARKFEGEGAWFAQGDAMNAKREKENQAEPGKLPDRPQRKKRGPATTEAEFFGKNPVDNNADASEAQ